MKKILIIMLFACIMCACNETVRRSFPSSKGHFVGYAFVYSYEDGDSEAERVGYFPVYRQESSLRIYVDEEEEEPLTLRELNTPRTLPGVPMSSFGYMYGTHYYVSKNISK